MKKWNIGIVGSGLIAEFHALAIIKLPNARLIGFCDNGSGRSRLLANKFDCVSFNNYASLIHDEKVDLITIASPSGAHMEPAIEAAKAGKHVLCEKPLEITLERVDRMIEAHEKAGTVLGGIFNFRFDEPVAYIKEAIDAERFGTITHAAVHVPWWRSEKYYEDNWHGTQALDGGGALMNQSIHMIDLLQYFMGPIDRLFAYTNNMGHPQIEVEDTGAAVLKFKNGSTGTIYGTTASFPGRNRRLEITGTHGTIEMVENSITCWQFKHEKETDIEIRKRFNQIAGKGGVSDPGAIEFENHKRNIQRFLESIETGIPFFIHGREARKAVEIIEAIYKSARVGKEIHL